MSLHDSSVSYLTSKKGLPRDLSKMPEAITRWPLLIELQYWPSRLQRDRLPHRLSFRFFLKYEGVKRWSICPGMPQAQSECRRRGRRCRYARRLASPHSPGRHLDCHAVGDRRPGCRSIPALKHVLAQVRDEVRYLTIIWLVHLFAINLGASARCLEIVHSISTIRHSARLLGTIAPYSA